MHKNYTNIIHQVKISSFMASTSQFNMQILPQFKKNNNNNIMKNILYKSAYRTGICGKKKKQKQKTTYHSPIC